MLFMRTKSLRLEGMLKCCDQRTFDRAFQYSFRACGLEFVIFVVVFCLFVCFVFIFLNVSMSVSVEMFETSVLEFLHV